MLIAIAKQRILCHNINNESKFINDIKTNQIKQIDFFSTKSKNKDEKQISFKNALKNKTKYHIYTKGKVY